MEPILIEHAFRSCYSGRHIVVTGGLGFLGAHLIRVLSDFDCKITRIIRTGAISERPISERLESRAEIVDICGDIRSGELWAHVVPQADFVFHFAGQTSNAVASGDAVLDGEANVLPMLRLLETCRSSNTTPVVLFASTVTVAGIPSHLPVDEHHPESPLTVYDLHKLIAENYLRYYSIAGFVRGVSLRLANVYGPGAHRAHKDRSTLDRMIKMALAGASIPIYGSGEFQRDYIYVDDVIGAFIAAGACIDALTERQYVIGSGRGHTIKEAFHVVAERAALKSGRAVRVENVDPPGGLTSMDTRNFIADSSRFMRATGWRANCLLREGIDRSIEAYLCAS